MDTSPPAVIQVTSCKCDEDSFGLFCERSKNLCEVPCFPKVACIPGKGCEACPPNMTGDGRHCAGELGTGSWQEEVARFWGQVIGQGSVMDKNNLVGLSLATRLQIPP